MVNCLAYESVQILVSIQFSRFCHPIEIFNKLVGNWLKNIMRKTFQEAITQ